MAYKNEITLKEKNVKGVFDIYLIEKWNQKFSQFFSQNVSDKEKSNRKFYVDVQGKNYIKSYPFKTKSEAEKKYNQIINSANKVF